MDLTTRSRSKLGLGAMLLLSACGGGGGGVQSTPAPVATTPVDTNPVATTPTTTTTTTTTSTTPTSVLTPSTVNYNDSEYGRSGAAMAASAITAWQAGATGAGIKVAVLDTGLTDANAEFAGRIDAASRAVTTGLTSYADEDGHGTAVAAVALAAHNGRDMEGVAFGATVLALRTDTSGSCGTSDGCKFNTATLATAIDVAVQNGARVINMSLGGASATGSFRAAINRATAAGVIVVIAAGNDGNDEPDPLAQIANESVARGLVIIAGSHDASGALSSFSDKAGTYGAYYLTALGSRVRAFDQTGTDYLWSGTSFSAPAISGAIALLAQAFPNLTATQIVSLLYSSATDAGAAGVDSTFGRGLLNLAKAFQPSGTLSLAGSRATVSPDGNALLSPAMGDAGAAGLGRAIVTDAYDRAYAVDLGQTVARMAARRPLGQALVGDISVRQVAAGGARISLTLARNPAGEPWAGLAQRGLTGDRAGQARLLAGTMLARIGRGAAVGLAFAGGGRTLDDALAGRGEMASFIAARGPADTPGFDGRAAVAAGVRHDVGRAALTATVERGALPRRPGDGRAPAYALATVRGARTIGPVTLAIGGGVLDEEASMLGARFGAALGGRGARTMLLDLDGALALGGGWTMRARWRRGWTSATAGGALTGARLRSGAAAIDLGRAGPALRYGLRLAMPTRVTAGGLALRLPVAYDYATGTVTYAPTRLGLVPGGRERDVEAAAGLRAGPGWLDANLYLRRDPGNIAALPDDRGMALRYALDF